MRADLMRRGLGVRAKLVGLVLLALLPCVALQAVGIEHAFRRSVQRELGRNQSYAQAVGTAFLNYLDDLWSSEWAVGSAIALDGRRGAVVPARALLEAQLPEHPGVRAFMWVRPDGVVAASTRRGAAGMDVAGRGYFRRIGAGASEAVSDLRRSAGGRPTIVVARAIRRGGRLLGIVAAAVGPHRLSAVLPTPPGDGSVYGLVDAGRSLVYRSDVGGAPRKDRLPDNPRAPAIGALSGRTTRSAGFRSALDGTVRMGAAVPLRRIGWAAFASIPVARALAGARRSAEADFGLLALFAVASLLAALALGRRFLRPVLAVQAAAAAISAGDLSARVQLRGEDEPAWTAVAFDLMADRVERLLGWQASVARLGERGLAGAHVRQLRDEALAIVCRHLGVARGLVLELVPVRDELVVRAASGWDAGGPPDHPVARSWEGYTLAVDEPVSVTDLAVEGRFDETQDWIARGVAAGVCVVIHGTEHPYGVLGAYALAPRSFTPEETFFVQTVANVLGTAIERRRVEERLRQANTRLNTLLEASPVPICAVDATGRLTVWNPAAERVFGWSAVEVLGRPLPTLPPGDAGERRRFEAVIAAERVYEGVVVRRCRRDGTLIEVELSSAGLRDAEGAPAGRIAILVDVTARSRFLQVAAHELRNPVAGAKGIVALLRRRLTSERPVGDLAPTLAVLEHEIDRFSTMLGQMLEAFRAHEGVLSVQREQIDLAAVVRAAVDAFRAAHEAFRFDLEGADARIWSRGDALRLEEVFCNLLSNAVKYSGDARVVRVVLRAGATHATVSVSDGGVGIPAQELGRVFDQFYRATNLPSGDPGGLGLGLFVCKEVVQRHGGRIWVESGDGGTTFHVDLPLDVEDLDA